MVEKKEEKVEVPKKFEEIVKKIEEMSVLDLAELVKLLEKKFGVSAAPQIIAAPAAATPG
ncbi:50S ribosomal protein L7/L12, partial [Patescibacteria group bacterium]|nr:50S ribosomal protein L7/L12 [Patescibacteria group bacterium]